MAFTSFGFFLLTAICVVIYYVVPKTYRWIWLLAVSAVYYASFGPALILYLLSAAAITWVGGRYAARGHKSAVILCLLANFGILAWLKYTNFFLICLSRIPGISFSLLHLALPLGISFYTFQSAGYLLDVYWKRCEPEPSFGKYLLFVSFFPQLMQGPIGRYQTLSPQLVKGHSYDPENISRGLIRITWGLFKKMVVADNAALYVDRIFGSWNTIRSLGPMAVLMYSAQLYADFSGGIDIALGIAQMMGIRLDENFRQPFFARSLTDFWHRWHITLGTWMKDYVFYPISLSGWMSSLRKKCRKWFGREMGRTIPVGIANLIVFLLVGVWHGPAWHFIFYGLYHGLIIAAGGILTGTFRKWKKACGVTDQTPWFHVFCMVRTFLIVQISWFLDRALTLEQARQMFFRSFFTRPFSIWIIDPADHGYCLQHFLPIVFGCLVLLAVSLLKERGWDPLEKAAHLPFPVRFLVVFCILVLCALFGNQYDGGFIYANF